MALAAVASAASAPSGAAPPAPEPLGIGDRLFPHLGNPGYDVAAYDIDLDYRGGDRPLDAVTRVDARATGVLHSLNLDFAGGTVRSVAVDGRRAAFARAGEDLVVTPRRPMLPGEPFRVTVRHTSDPRGLPGGSDSGDGGWIRTLDGLAMANQADAAHRVFPCNDHPSDKARFTFHVTAPRDLTVVAGGVPVGRERHGARTTWEYRVLHPMATELAQVSIGRSAVVRGTGPGGLPLRDVVPAADRERLAPWLARTPDQLAWMEDKTGGPYPFETYGLLIARATTGFELETQTLSLFEHRLFTTPKVPEWYVDSVMVHELAHQWFGDSVTPRTWSDLWLNEGHATWYEALYAQERGGRPLARRMRAAYAHSDTWRADGGPPAAPEPGPPGRHIGIFRPTVYDGGALVLYALREEIGAAAFERLERAWVRRHRDSVASTGDFVRLASRVAGRDLAGFLHPWLYGRHTPPMPGHPEWRSAARRAALGAKSPGNPGKPG
ncbi:M1 family metallopeptidase [Streptomyces sp. B1866]|uniref:M1 family metallopeptidase n=1 Tax=Streptomyces sp. B1866 TaxID=3075431 RepID=UPI0028910169|nr:M1 family metallopeptidase [Streptomyces sp. B1866]MDT3400159.1 M1 family metallopeptidase [Streptomyces sp. B1866]